MKNAPSDEDFDSRLRAAAQLARQRVAPSGDLAQRILADVHHSRADAVVHQPRRGWRLSLISFASLAACAAVTFMMFRSDPVMPGGSVLPADPSVIASTRSVAPTAIWDEMKPKAQALLAHDPLQSEVDAVVSDARSALQFLALNFLPSTSAADSQPRRG